MYFYIVLDCYFIVIISKDEIQQTLIFYNIDIQNIDITYQQFYNVC